MRIGVDPIVRGVVVSGLVLLVCAAAGLFDDRLPSRPLLFNRFQTPEISGTRRIEQRFFINKPDLHTVVIRPAAVGPVTGKVRVELRDVRDGGVVRSQTVAAADLVRSDRYRVEFAPIRESRGHLYRLEFSSDADTPSRGVALWATRTPPYRDGFLSLNGLDRFANLAYEIPMPPRRTMVLIALVPLALAWLAFGCVLKNVPR